GIAPTLIIVRVAYQKSVDSVQQMVSIHFAEHESQREVGNRAIQTALGIHSDTQHDNTSSGPPLDKVLVEEKHNEGQIV
ncbi:hypothetical protein AAF712_016436, partial [Marasmius tenuissimus]